MNAQMILEKKGFEDAAAIVFEELDQKVRELYNVSSHPIHLWERYCIGDANESELLLDAESNTTPIHRYENSDSLFEDMTREIERLASIYE